MTRQRSENGKVSGRKTVAVGSGRSTGRTVADEITSITGNEITAHAIEFAFEVEGPEVLAQLTRR